MMRCDRRPQSLSSAVFAIPLNSCSAVFPPTHTEWHSHSDEKLQHGPACAPLSSASGMTFSVPERIFRFGPRTRVEPTTQRVELLPKPESRAEPRSADSRHVIEVGARISSTRPQSSAVGCVDRLAEQSERRGPLSSDATGEARRAAGAGDQAERHLRERDSCVRIGDDPAGERRHLDPAAERRTVDAHLDPVTEPFDQRGRAARQPGDVGRDRIGAAAELPEVSAAAERRAVAADDHLADRVVDQRDRQRGVEFVAQSHRDRVVAMRSIERQRQPTAVALDQHRRPVGIGVGLRRCGGAPRCELGSALEHRVHRRFCGERRRDRQRLGLSQQDRQRDRRLRHLFDLLDERGAVGGVECDVRPSWRVVGAGPAHDDRCAIPVRQAARSSEPSGCTITSATPASSSSRYGPSMSSRYSLVETSMWPMPEA